MAKNLFKSTIFLKIFKARMQIQFLNFYLNVMYVNIHSFLAAF